MWEGLQVPLGAGVEQAVAGRVADAHRLRDLPEHGVVPVDTRHAHAEPRFFSWVRS